MTLITQIEDRGAVVAWCPLSSHADFVALGLKDSGGGGFDTTSYGSELEFYNLNITTNDDDDKPKLLGSIKTTSRFASIGWCSSSNAQKYPMGFVAGGMEDGVVHIWDPNAILAGSSEENALISTIVSKQGTSGSNVVVTALKFNPHSSTELGIGYSNGEVTVMSLENDPHSPERIFPLGDDGDDASYTPMVQGGEITKLSWNSQVSHILASACSNGIVAIYDIKSGKLWCELRCESTPGAIVSDVVWNPTEGLHIMTASGDDRNPVMKLWDCRASTTVPLATLAGHSQGILNMSWCPHDPSLLLSCGKDNKTLLWDLYALQPIYEFPSNESSSGGGTDGNTTETDSNAVFGVGGLSSSQQRRYFISWSPIRRGLALSCSFDRKVQVHSVIGAAAKTGRTPQWLKRPNGVSTGFGGTLVSFNATHKYVTVKPHVEEPALVTASNNFEQEQASKDYITLCNNKATNAASTGDADEAKIWGFMQIIFEANAREQLLQYLGFDPEEISEMASSAKDSNEENITEDMAGLSLGQSSKKNVDEIIKQSLIVGNFEAAVECCFQSGNYADGLVLSSCGGADLWAKTQARYFEAETEKRPFLNIVSAVINNKLEELVLSSDPSSWRETLAIISTYGKTEEFPALCLSLGNRLEESGDVGNASLCFMCALCLDKAVRFWKLQLDNSGTDIMALHSFMEKVTTFLQALDPSVTLSPTTLGSSDVMDVFYSYAVVLADQGLLETSARYCRGESQACMELIDRLYHSRASHTVRSIIGSTPVFPFLKTEVNVARARTNNGTRNQQQQQPAQSTNIARESDELPSGWLALQDPSSGMTYFANQTTGETTWDKPSPPDTAPTPQQTYASQMQQQYPGQQQQGHHQVQQQSQQQQYPSTQQTSYTQQQPQYNSSTTMPGQIQQQPNTTTSNGRGTSPKGPSNVADKYGDGFVSSASHPELAQKYGNVGTSNPYTGADRPGIAIVPGSQPATSSTQSVANIPFDPSNPPQVASEQQHISDILISMIQALSASTNLLASEKKQLAESTKAVGILLNRLSRGDLPTTVIDIVNAIVTALQNRDYATATSVQTSAVSTIWRDHKDWLKGMKFLIQLASRRLQ